MHLIKLLFCIYKYIAFQRLCKGKYSIACELSIKVFSKIVKNNF